MTTKNPKVSASMTALWADPNRRAQYLAARQASPGYSSPDRAKRIQAAALARWADPEFKARMAETAWQNPKPIVFSGIVYPSTNEAVRSTGITKHFVRKGSQPYCQTKHADLPKWRAQP